MGGLVLVFCCWHLTQHLLSTPPASKRSTSMGQEEALIEAFRLGTNARTPSGVHNEEAASPPATWMTTQKPTTPSHHSLLLLTAGCVGEGGLAQPWTRSAHHPDGASASNIGAPVSSSRVRLCHMGQGSSTLAAVLTRSPGDSPKRSFGLAWLTPDHILVPTRRPCGS